MPVRTPESYADIFIILRELNIIDTEFSNRMIEMAKYRNRLVHPYWDLDPEKTYRSRFIWRFVQSDGTRMGKPWWT
jgi:uncharacterized protein YutE (UPF0331/DUF86 family)